MTQFLNPFSGRQYLDSNGNPYVGGKLFSYTAGTSTKATLTKDEAGSSNHTNPIILNARGEPADAGGSSQAMWQTAGVSIKLVLAPSTDTDPPLSAISTWDNLDGINDGSLISDQWIAGPAPTYISATSFSLVGDKTTDFHVGRRLKTTNTAGTIYSTIASAAFTTLTTVTVVNDSGVLDSGLSAVSYGLISATNNSVPGGAHEAMTFWKQGIGPKYLQNIGITSSVASKALTVTLTTKELAALTTTNYAQIEHRNSTLTTGNTVTRKVTSATSVVAPNGATLGFTASQTGYVYVYIQEDGAGIANELMLSGSNHWDESVLQTSTTISATADSGSVLYSSFGRGAVPIRYIGRIKINTGAVAGEWDNAPTEVHVGAMPNRAAEVMQVVYTVDGVNATGTTIIPGDNTIPQNTEGDQYMSLSITPKDSKSILLVDVIGNISNTATSPIIAMALFRDSVANALATVACESNGSNILRNPMALSHVISTGSTSAITIKIRAGANIAGTTTFNGSLYGGTVSSTIRITEVLL